ncbi:vitelline envelope sperm lysin receptor-like isoform X2 [Haliotis rubra]|uniref:vitelline envelope sperm lysin receptor-like isoform X2 n=1 Tax=Haliotis rubra TaxID=36100 RepID=UPI001EE5EAF1|nr:vitelline envelope sperm lysin receptor-like isoform X2 [Haliotis rubra]
MRIRPDPTHRHVTISNSTCRSCTLRKYKFPIASAGETFASKQSSGMAVSALVFAGLVASIVAELPTGYILTVQPNCGSDSSSEASIAILADFDIAAKAVCHNGGFSFERRDPVHYSLNLVYPGSPSQDKCIFKKKPGSEKFEVTVFVSFGTSSETIHRKGEKYTVTCPNSNDSNSNQISNDGLTAQEEIHPVKRNKSKITLHMTDVTGTDLSGQNVHLKSMVLLTATSNGAEHELGIKPVSCDAVSLATSKKYTILRAGCGDGQVLPKTRGFVTSGLVTRSPYFEVFSIDGEEEMKFECNFTICARNCDGSSCTTSRKRRGTFFGEYSDYQSDVVASSAIVSRIPIFAVSRPEQALGRVVMERFVDHGRGNLLVAFSILGSLALLSVILTITICVLTLNKTPLRHKSVPPVE